MLKLVIFDFDGLMVNTENVVYAAIAELLKTHNIEFLWGHYAKHIGRPVDDALRGYIKDLSLPLSFDQFVSQRHTIVERFMEEKLAVMPGLEDLLSFLWKIRVRMAIATSGKREYVMKYLEKFRLVSYFDAVVCIDDVKKGKPHPDLIRKTLDIMRCQPEQALMLEDSLHGIESARQANVFIIAVPQPSVDIHQYRNADCICKTLTDVYNLLSLLLVRRKVSHD